MTAEPKTLRARSKYLYHLQALIVLNARDEDWEQVEALAGLARAHAEALALDAGEPDATLFDVPDITTEE